MLFMIFLIIFIIVGFILCFWRDKQSKYKYELTYNHVIRYNTREIIYKLDDYLFSSSLETLPKFSFQQFLNFYNLNPDMWLLTDDHDKIVNIPCRIEWRVPNEIKRYERTFDYYPIFFTNWIELKKYQHWVKQYFKEKEEQKIKEERNQATKEFCELVQKDIDRAYQNLEESINNYQYAVDVVNHTTKKIKTTSK